MFLYHSRVYTRILFLADIFAGLGAAWVAYQVRSLVRFLPLEVSAFFNPVLLPFRDYVFFLVLFLPVWCVILHFTQKYRELLFLSVFRQISRAVFFLLWAGFLMGFLIFTFQLKVSRPVFFGVLLMTGILMIANRLLLTAVLKSRNVNEHNQINILLVGARHHVQPVAKRLEGSRLWGFHVKGFVTTRPSRDDRKKGRLACLGTLNDLPELLRSHRIVVDEVIFVGRDARKDPVFDDMLEFCRDLGIRARVAADFFPASAEVSLEFLDQLPLITLSMSPEHGTALVIKRVVDFVVAVSCLLLLSPVMLLVAALVRFTSPGPILYRQKRCGRFGRRFTLVKFRTMVEGAEDRLWEIRHLNEMSGPVFKMSGDPRITPVGRLLRKFSLDEIPQFWNVIKGEMSVVGPRAPLPEEVENYSIKQLRRLSVKPGITCLWQVSGRSEIDFHEWMALDLQYIDNWSLWLDLRIMLRTIPAVFTGRGAR